MLRIQPLRRGFTLIELLVTMALIILLLSIAVAVSNSSTLDSYKITNAGDKVSQALITAKARAARDKSPRGIRLIAGPDGYIRELIYIEQPEPWLPDQLESFGRVPGNPPEQPIMPNRSMLAVKYPQLTPAPPNTYPKPDPQNCRVFLLLNAITPPDRPGPTGLEPRGLSDYERFIQQLGGVGTDYLQAPNSNPTQFALSNFYTVSTPDLGAAYTFNAFDDVTAIPALRLEFGPAVGYRVLMLGNRAAINPALPLQPPRLVNPDLAAGQSPTPANAALPYRATFQTTKFGIYPPPQPLAGEPTMLLSTNVAVDSFASLPPVPQNPGSTIFPSEPPQVNNIDILFAPAGHVMNRSDGLIAFLVRDTTKLTPTPPNPVLMANSNWLIDPTVGQDNYRRAGEMMLVVIYPKTGGIATKPVAEPDGTILSDPYKFAKDAIRSGL